MNITHAYYNMGREVVCCMAPDGSYWERPAIQFDKSRAVVDYREPDGSIHQAHILKPEPVQVMNFWLDALEGGRFRQIYAKPTDNLGGFCAIGLLLHVAAHQKDAIKWISKRLGEKRIPIVHLNDVEKLTFPEIAQVIRSQFIDYQEADKE